MQNKLRITHESPETLTPDPENLMMHDDRNYKAVKNSIQEFGIRKPVVAHEGSRIVYAGNLTLKVAKDLGYATIPVAWIPADIPKEKARAYGVADNRTAQFGEFDIPALGEFLAELPELVGIDTETIGFNQEEIAEILGGNEATEIEEDEIPEKVIPFTKPGDIWHLGGHKVICGDCTDKGVVDTVTEGRKADLCLTDPPYSVGYENRRRNVNQATRIEKGDVYTDPPSALALLNGFLSGLPTDILVMTYVFAVNFQALAKATAGKWELLYECVWVKQRINFSMGLKYQIQHEPILIFRRKGGQKGIWNTPSNASTIFAYDRAASNPDHPTPRPLPMWAKLVEYHSNPQSLVFDPFLGSGTTLIACEQLNRICRGIEIEPVYVDLIVQRFINLNPDENPSKITLERNKERIPYPALSL